MLEHIARHKGYIPTPSEEDENGTVIGLHSNGPPRGRAVARAGAGRLRDAIVFGYMMQRHRARGKVCKHPNQAFESQDIPHILLGMQRITRQAENMHSRCTRQSLTDYCLP